MADIIHLLPFAADLAIIVFVALAWMDLKRTLRSPNLPPARPLEKKRVVTSPGGQFVVDDSKGLDAVVLDDETVYNHENNL